MGIGLRIGWRRVVALWVTITMAVAAVSTGTAAGQEPDAEAEAPDWAGPDTDELQPWSPDDDPQSPPVAAQAPIPLASSEPSDHATATQLPAPASAAVTLGRAGERKNVSDTPIDVAAGATAANGLDLQVEVLDRNTATRAGVTGFVFRLTGRDSAALAGSAGEAVPVELAIDYSRFADAFGANWPDRMQLVALPACALVTPRPAGCSAGVAVPSRLDLENKQLVAEVDDLGAFAASELGATRPNSSSPDAGSDADTTATTTTTPSTTAPADGVDAPESTDGAASTGTTTTAAEADQAASSTSTTSTPPATTTTTLGARGADRGDAAAIAAADATAGVVLAVTSAPSGAAGDFTATPLELSSEWQVGIGSGEFSWSYPFGLPAAPAGATPEVALSYSSGSVDGMVTTRNTQAPQNGVGWGDFANAFIERRYWGCGQDATSGGDLCWKKDNATISLAGRAAEMVAVPGSNPTQWRLKDDPRWKVQQFRGASGNNDNDGEHWRVTTPDGTEFWFGQNAESVYYVPVVGDDSGEPCYSGGPGICNQAWRWNLNKVVDRNGNTTTYNYLADGNHYLGRGNVIRPYERAGQLVRISYGANGSQAAVAKVEFGTQHRCAALNSTCTNPGRDATGYPDVPTDLICTSTSCGQTSPSFFSSKRYSSVTTFVGSTAVDRWQLNHQHRTNDEGDDKLHLISVQRVDPAAPTTGLLPPVEFDYRKLPNRLDEDPGAGITALSHFRLSEITNEFGGTVAVTYGQKSACTPGSQAGRWDTNTKDCFPQWWVPDGGTGRFAEFHKWLTTQVVESDGTANPTPITTTYAYGDPAAAAGSLEAGAAWHDDNDELTPDAQQSWSDWRGYGTVTVTKGSSVTRYRVFRGMHGDDRAGTGTGSKSVTIRSLDDAARTEVDENFLAGRTFDEAQLKNGVTERGTLHDYTSARLVDLADPIDEPYWVGESETIERRRAPGGAFATRRTTTAYNPLLLFPETVTEHGWGDQTGDERCTRTDYVWNVTSNADPALEVFMVDFPRATTMYAGTSCSGTELRRGETAYDGGAYGAAPTRGNPTATRTKLTASPLAWSETLTAYDALGRPIWVIDPNGRSTITVHTPGTGYPTKTEVHNAKAHKATTTWLVARQAPQTVTDPNGHVTTYAYDKLGRVTSVHQPTEPTSGPASWQFVYTIAADKARGPVVRTRRLQSTGPAVYVDSWAVYDGLVRERQAHRLSPAAGRVIVTDTRYNARGLAESVSLPEAVSGTPGSGILPAPSPGWANETLTFFDELQRPVWEVLAARDADGEPVASRSTVTSYTHNTVTVDPHNIDHVGGEVRTVTDAYDRPIRVEEQEGSAWRTTSYGYNLAGDLTAVTDPAGHPIRYGYDLGGRRIGMDDPDSGFTTDANTWGWSYAYDPAGNQTRVTDARGVATFTNYDELNRPTERRSGNATTGPKLSEWTYDAEGELGLLNSSIRWHHTGGHPGAYAVDVLGYDARNRPLGRSWILFSQDVPGLEGVYEVGYGYDRADHVTSVHYPEVGDPQNGGLPEETVTTTYNSLGLPVKLDGSLLPTGEVDEDYAISLGAWGYDDRARPLLWAQGPVAGEDPQWLLQLRQYDADQRLSHIQAMAVDTVLQDHQLDFDELGNVVEDNAFLDAKGWRECFGYDQRNRLTRAYTTAPVEDCGSGTAGGGDANFAFNHTYSYSVDGNLTRRVEGPDQTDEFTYTYPSGATAVRPHAPTAIDGPSESESWDYTWDQNGHHATRTVGGNTDTLVWSPDRLLDQIEEANGNVKNRFVYDADGNRLVRTNVDGRTAFIEGHELNANNSGSEIKVVRTYMLEGRPVAIRTAQGVEHLVADDQGSVELTIPSGSPTPSHVRAYAPYGGKRSSAEPATDRGWIGQIEDDRTGLNYLNARYYDPVMGRFLAPDAVYDIARPQTLNPYAYSINNPATYADPTGLAPCVAPTCGGTVGFVGAPAAAAVGAAVGGVVAGIAAGVTALATAGLAGKDLPNLPNLPNLPKIPGGPDLPDLWDLPDLPKLPSFCAGPISLGDCGPSLDEVLAAAAFADQVLAGRSVDEGVANEFMEALIEASNGDGTFSFVADSNVFMSRPSGRRGAREIFDAILASPDVTLYVTESALGEISAGDIWRLNNAVAQVEIVKDPELPSTFERTNNFDAIDATVVQRAQDSSIPVLTANAAMRNQVTSNGQYRGYGWHEVPFVVVPP